MDSAIPILRALFLFVLVGFLDEPDPKRITLSFKQEKKAVHIMKSMTHFSSLPIFFILNSLFIQFCFYFTSAFLFVVYSCI